MHHRFPLRFPAAEIDCFDAADRARCSNLLKITSSSRCDDTKANRQKTISRPVFPTIVPDCLSGRRYAVTVQLYFSRARRILSSVKSSRLRFTIPFSHDISIHILLRSNKHGMDSVLSKRQQRSSFKEKLPRITYGPVSNIMTWKISKECR